MNSAAENIGAITDKFNSTKGGVTGVEGESPFGAMAGSDGISGAVGSFTSGMQKEFEAAANLMKETGEALRRAAQLQRDTDDAAADSVTVQDPGGEKWG